MAGRHTACVQVHNVMNSNWPVYMHRLSADEHLGGKNSPDSQLKQHQIPKRDTRTLVVREVNGHRQSRSQ